MAQYTTIKEVQTWWDVRGCGEPLVLLHGGFSDSRDFEGNLIDLAQRGYRVFVVDRRAHGRTPDVPGPVGTELLVEDLVAFFDHVVGSSAHVAGYSDGGRIALALALRRPDLVRKLVLINTAAARVGWVMLPDTDSEFPTEVIDAYAEVSPDGREHFGDMARKYLAMADEPDLDPSGVASATLVLGADDDIVHLEHTVELYRSLPAGQLAVLPATTHLLLWEKPALATEVVEQFLASEPNRMMPVRFATTAPDGHDSSEAT